MSYYDPYPIVHVEQPLTLIGFIGAETGMIGRLLCSVTGLRFALLDTLVAHAVGTTRAEFLRARGEQQLAAIEAEALDRALDDRPAGILVLGHGSLLDRRNLHRVRRASRLIYVHRPLEALVPRIAARGKDHPELDDVRNEPDLRALLRARAPGYAAADMRVDGEDRAPLDIAREIARHLDWPVFERG